MATLERLLTDESAQGFTEYALILALVALGVVGAVTAFRERNGSIYEGIVNRLEEAFGN